QLDVFAGSVMMADVFVKVPHVRKVRKKMVPQRVRKTFSLALFATAFLWVSLTNAAELPQAEFPLWEKGAPGALGTESKDTPTLTPYYPSAGTATGAAVIICPGGGYGGLAKHEGADYAHWLNAHGIAAFVLKYRLGSGGYRHPVMLGDAARAVR